MFVSLLDFNLTDHFESCFPKSVLCKNKRLYSKKYTIEIMVMYNTKS